MSGAHPFAAPGPRPPILWSIAGMDTAGGAGLSADQRAADALGVHLCPVVAALTAQNSQGVQSMQPGEAAWLDAQMQALAWDLPPAVIKTGLLGSVQAVQAVARWVDALRRERPHQPVRLVVDPVLGATAGGAAFCDDAVLQAYRHELVPRATLITPNRAEARRLLGRPGVHEGPQDELPALAQALRDLGAQHVVITGGDAPAARGHCLDWMETPLAQGWLALPRVDTAHHHGSGCAFAAGAAAAIALGHPMADAVVLAKMLVWHALAGSHAAGRGAGPVMPRRGFAQGPAHGGAPLPWLGLGRDLPWQLTEPPHNARDAPPPPLFLPCPTPPDHLYGIAATQERVTAALDAGLRCVQLRHKAQDGLAPHLAASVLAAARAGAKLFVNDHWRDALAMAPAAAGSAPGFALGIHLGQEDLLDLGAEGRAALLAQRGRVMLGLSSHSLWELSRAAGCGASTIACGPVLPTTTKDMPWRPQGEDNLRWWVAHSPAPVLAIGGLLTPADVRRFAACGPAALCLVRALGEAGTDLHQVLPAFREAVATGRAQAVSGPAALPHPVI